MTFGLTPTGFNPKTSENILADLQQAIQNAFGVSVDVANGLLARFLGILTERYVELWELAEAIYNSQDPDTATGAALDALAVLTGSFRIAASYSTGAVTLTGSVGIAPPIGTGLQTASTLRPFITTTAPTLLALAAWAPSTVYAAGAQVTNNGNAYQCTVGGLSAGSGGPTTSVVYSLIVDGGVTWRFLGIGVAAAIANVQASTLGTVVGVAGDLTVIQTPYGGLTGAVNLLDMVVGYNTQADQAFRITREEELSEGGVGTINSIRAAVLAIAGVTSCTVFVNQGDTTDGNGLSPHSVEVLVIGGASNDIANVLLAQVSAGTATVGTASGTATDSQGVIHTLRFTRPAVLDIGVAVTLVYDATLYPPNGNAQVALAIATFGNAQLAGKDAVSSSLLAQCFSVPGVLDVQLPLISSATAPSVPPTPTTTTTIPVSVFQLATYNTAWITVSSSPATP